MRTVARVLFAFFIATVLSSIAMALYYVTFSNSLTTFELLCARDCDGAEHNACARTMYANGTFPEACGTETVENYQSEISKYSTKRIVASIWMGWQIIPLHILTSDVVAMIAQGHIFVRGALKPES
ncbi:hypothetical protein HK104_003462 [Borealophlyctis nickersoniae]|nr:hypothetical protein HK104_003462 [Borealophlyctis nickersoniae]